MKRWSAAVFWLTPVAYALWLYWWGLQAWFQQDDFAWLGLPLHLNKPGDLWEVLFAPQAQGTIRPWSERLYFLVFSQVAWLDPRPFHAWALVTACIVLWLLSWLTLRITASRVAALAAPIVWLSGVGPANPMSWISSYNQLMASLFLLGGLACLVKAAETGSRRWWAAQWACFLLGFGALEIQVIYPALALGYAVLFARHAVKRVLWILPISVVYVALNFTYAPKPTSGPYARHWDLSMASTFFEYCKIALGGGKDAPGNRLPNGAWLWVALVCGLALVGWAVWQAWRAREWGGIFGLFWFCALLGPVLPLRDHVMEYYLTTPTLGLALTAGAALGAAWQAWWGVRGLAAALLALHLLCVLPLNRAITLWRYERGERIRKLVQGLERAVELHPSKVILLAGIDSELFWSCLLDSPARLFGAMEVFLAPGEEKGLEQHPDLGNMQAYVAEPALTARVLAQGSAVVYRFDGERLVNITRSYRRQVPQGWLVEKPRLIDVAHPAFASDLGPGWMESDGTSRWMGQKAEVRLAPPIPGATLYLSAHLPQGHAGRARLLTVYLNGEKLGEHEIGQDEEWVEAAFPVPETHVGRAAVVALEVDSMIQLPGDPARYGLAFGKIGFR